MSVDHVEPLGDEPKRSDKERLVIEMAAEIRAAWDARCAALGEKPGPAARRLIEASLAGQASPTTRAAPFQLGTSGDERKKVERKVYFTPSEDLAIQAVSSEWGFGYAEWIVATVRAALTGSPAFGQAELEALTASNVLLGQLAADVAAFERAASVTSVSLDLLQLRLEIREHIRTASELMAQAVRRWEIKK